MNHLTMGVKIAMNALNAVNVIHGSVMIVMLKHRIVLNVAQR